MYLNPAATPIIAFGSGKGGVGKTSLLINTVKILAQEKMKCLIFDGDFGLANIDVQLGLQPKYDLSCVLSGKSTLREIVHEVDSFLHFIPGRSGDLNLPFMTGVEQHQILNQLKDLATSYDIVFIDAPAGLDAKTLSLCAFADQTALVVTPDPSSITDAYAFIKLLKLNYGYTHCGVIVNQAHGQLEAKRTFQKLQTAAQSFLNITLPQFSSIPEDTHFSSAVKLQKTAVEAFPQAKASQAIKELAHTFRPFRGLRKRA